MKSELCEKKNRRQNYGALSQSHKHYKNEERLCTCEPRNMSVKVSNTKNVTSLSHTWKLTIPRQTTLRTPTAEQKPDEIVTPTQTPPQKQRTNWKCDVIWN